MHSFAHKPMSLFMPFHKNLSEMRRRVALIPGCPSPWRWSKTFLRSPAATSGRKKPRDTSPKRRCVPTGMSAMMRRGFFFRACTWGQSTWAAARSSMDAGGGGRAASAVPTAAKENDPTCFGGGGGGGLERASATALSLPATWRMSVVYSATVSYTHLTLPTNREV